MDIEKKTQEKVVISIDKILDEARVLGRSEERRVGKECM